MSEASPSDLFSQDFLDALPPLPSPGEMQAWDQESARLGIPEAVLMENAARAALAVLKTGIPNLAGKHIALFMGGGNNGGDAACLARQLLDAGAYPMVFCAKTPAGYGLIAAFLIFVVADSRIPPRLILKSLRSILNSFVSFTANSGFVLIYITMKITNSTVPSPSLS